MHKNHILNLATFEKDLKLLKLENQNKVVNKLFM